MYRNKIITYIIILLFTTSCIEEYKPEILTSDLNRYVVNGRVTSMEGNQTIIISQTSSISRPDYIPVSGCDVKIIDDQGNVFQLAENAEGEYQVFIGAEYLAEGSAFMTEIVTPEGDLIVSDYDTLHYAPPVDTIYYIKEEKYTSDPNETMTKFQFYVDYDGVGTDAKYLKWEVDETWEFHSKYPKVWIYDGYLHEFPPDYSTYLCYRNFYIKSLYVATTENFAENIYRKFPLYSIKYGSERLAYGYSINLHQFALSKEAFTYYDQLNENILTDKGLYYSQPIVNEGNLRNTSDPDQVVLGYFYASGVQTKRVFIEPPENYEYNPVCGELSVAKRGLRSIPWREWPAYVWISSDDILWIKEDCYDCTCLKGSTLDKPDFWPY